MHVAYQVPDRPLSPPEPTREEEIQAREHRAYVNQRLAYHEGQFRKALANDLHVKRTYTDGTVLDWSAVDVLPATCDYHDLTLAEIAFLQTQVKSTNIERQAESAQAYVDALINRAVSLLRKEEAAGVKIEYGAK